MDVHIPKAITDAVRRCGVDVVTAQDENVGMKTDENFNYNSVGISINNLTVSILLSVLE